MKRYEVLANAMAEEIRSGSVAVGSRMPSLRRITAQHGVSQSTVFRAYYLLEEWGLIRVRERSGHYVAPGASVASAPARKSVSLVESRKVDNSDLVFSVLDATKEPRITPLGSAFPSPHLFPLPRLAKSLARGARLVTPWSTVADLAPGNEQLRRQIALRYLGMGFSRSIDDIVITSGVLEALNPLRHTRVSALRPTQFRASVDTSTR
jgi:DNA-binding transcriptional MocR family regulator